MATLQDRFNINSQLEHLQAKYVGTGHADLQRFEWAGELPWQSAWFDLDRKGSFTAAAYRVSAIVLRAIN